LRGEKGLAWKKIANLLKIDEKMAQRDLQVICEAYKRESSSLRSAREVYLEVEKQGLYANFDKDKFKFNRTNSEEPSD
jgi:hypothetical protein